MLNLSRSQCYVLLIIPNISILVLRFGKSMDMFQGALKSLMIDDGMIRFALTLSKLNQAFYLLVDHFIWLGKVGIIKTDTKRWAIISARFWLITIFFNLVRNVYDVLRIMKEEGRKKARAKKEMGTCDATGYRRTLCDCLSDNKPAVVDSVKNICDLFLPLSSLGYVNISAGLQGLMGVTSSIMGIATVWDPLLKLSPA